MTLPIGGFMPIPLAMMIPFMATQSMVMGDAFGRAFQYGKRKISAMSNEEFNATSMEQQASQMFASYKNIIPTLTQSIQDSQTLQEKIIREMLLILPRFATSEELFKPEPFKVAGQSTIQDVVTGSPENTAKVTDATANFFNSMAQLFKGVSFNSPFDTPPSAAISDTSIQTFTQEQQDIQDAGKQSDIPITLSSLSYKQIENLYSDMLSNRITLSTKERQQLTLAFKAGKDRTPPPAEFTKTPTHLPEIQEYRNIRDKHLQAIVESKTTMSKFPGPHPTARITDRQRNGSPNYQNAKRALTRAQLLLKNHITRARNVIALKSHANKDWNDRIWK